MNKILVELLNKNARVIIPDFGAFIIKQKSPRIVIFNEFLRYNDGLLIDYVTNSQNTDKESAKNTVNNFVKDINQKLKNGEDYIIEGLGKLVRASTGKITLAEISVNDLKTKPFTEEQEIQKADKKKGVENKQHVEEIPKSEIEDKEPELGVIKKSPLDTIIIKDKKEETSNQKETESVKKEIELPVKETEVPKKEAEIVKKETKPETKETIIIKKQHQEPVTNTTGNTTSASTKQNSDKTNKNNPVYQPEEKKQSFQVIIWILLIIIVNAAIIVWFVYNDEITSFYKKDITKITRKKDKTEKIDKKIADVTSGKEKDKTQNVPDDENYSENTKSKGNKDIYANYNQSVQDNNVSSSVKNYYIVAGCFLDENNADVMVSKLKAKGFDARKFGKIGDLFAVSYKSFSDKSAAYNELSTIRSTVQEDAWVIYY